MKSESKGLFYATLEREPRVLAYDNEGTDGGFIVTLVKGFAFYDAAETATDDPDGAMACHGSSFPTVKEAMEYIRVAKPCKCGRCLS
jgi:hypothetical protein